MLISDSPIPTCFPYFSLPPNQKYTAFFPFIKKQQLHTRTKPIPHTKK